jgi:hypothetical protein
MAAGTPGLSLLVIAILVFGGWRFWQIGLEAWHGNARLIAFAAMGLGLTSILTGPMWTFGIRSRKIGAVVFCVAAICFLLFNSA